MARLLKLDERTLSSLKPRKKNKRVVKPGKSPEKYTEIPVIVQSGNENLINSLENHILSLLLRDPEAIFVLDRILVGANMERFSSQDFEHSDTQWMSNLIIASTNQDEEEAIIYIDKNMPDSSMPLLMLQFY